MFLAGDVAFFVIMSLKDSKFSKKIENFNLIFKKKLVASRQYFFS